MVATVRPVSAWMLTLSSDAKMWTVSAWMLQCGQFEGCAHWLLMSTSVCVTDTWGLYEQFGSSVGSVSPRSCCPAPLGIQVETNTVPTVLRWSEVLITDAGAPPFREVKESAVCKRVVTGHRNIPLSDDAIGKDLKRDQLDKCRWLLVSNAQGDCSQPAFLHDQNLLILNSK